MGLHTTAPHSLAIDSNGMAHLVVADVNTSQDNRLDLYWVIGDPKTGKWNAAWLIDRRGFTSMSSPWSAARSDKVYLIWTWCDVSRNKRAPGMGAFYLEWNANGFGRKTRIFDAPVDQLDAAFDPQSGLLVVVLAKAAGGVYVLARSAEGKWTRPSLLHPTPRLSVVFRLTRGKEHLCDQNSWSMGMNLMVRKWVLRAARDRSKQDSSFYFLVPAPLSTMKKAGLRRSTPGNTEDLSNAQCQSITHGLRRSIPENYDAIWVP
jgi:hypothetical protein